MSASGTPATQGVKEEQEVEGYGFVRIKVRDNARFRVTYRMRKTARLQALMDFYYNRVPAVDRSTGRFFFCGTRVQGWQTPAHFNMEDGDEVDVFTEQLPRGVVTNAYLGIMAIDRV